MSFVAITRMVGIGVASVLSLSLALAPAAPAQNGFPAAKAAVDQYEEPTPQQQPPASQPQGQPQAVNNGGNSKAKPVRRGTEQSRPTKKTRKGCTRGAGTATASAVSAACPAGGLGPDSAAGGGKNKAAAHVERGSALPLAEAQGGKLPFTGLDLSTFAALGVLLLAAGFALRAGSRTRSRLRVSPAPASGD
jgi:hypothetical protein